MDDERKRVRERIENDESLFSNIPQASSSPPRPDFPRTSPLFLSVLYASKMTWNKCTAYFPLKIAYGPCKLTQPVFILTQVERRQSGGEK